MLCCSFTAALADSQMPPERKRQNTIRSRNKLDRHSATDSAVCILAIYTSLMRDWLIVWIQESARIRQEYTPQNSFASGLRSWRAKAEGRLSSVYSHFTRDTFFIGMQDAVASKYCCTQSDHLSGEREKGAIFFRSTHSKTRLKRRRRTKPRERLYQHTLIFDSFTSEG